MRLGLAVDSDRLTSLEEGKVECTFVMLTNFKYPSCEMRIVYVRSV